MKKPALLVALSLSVLACDSDSSDAGGSQLGDVALSDSTDASGKADALMGRQVEPYFTEIVAYGPQTASGKSTVTDIDDERMVIEAPLVELPDFEESLQVTIGAAAEGTDMRFFLVYSPDGDSLRIITVEGPGEFEDGDEAEEGSAQPTSVIVSYFEQISILKSENSISVASDGAGGQTTSDSGDPLGNAKGAKECSQHTTWRRGTVR